MSHPAEPTTTRIEIETLIADVVCLQLRLDARRSEMEQAISEIRSSFSGDIDALEKELVEKRAHVQLWADENREFFHGKKSLECHQATIGFRSGPPRLEKIQSNVPWNEVARKLGRFAWGNAYLRTPEPEPEVNREAILADRHKLLPAKLEKAGLRIVQDEKFYITPRMRMAENLLKAAA
jgi:phage host-nuclease inhibitor protein Gam